MKRVVGITVILFLTLFAIATPSLATTPGNDLPRTDDETSATEFTLAGDVPADWCQRLKAMPNVRKLTIRRPDLTHFKAAQLKELPQLTSVRAEDFPLESPLADAVAVNLARLPGLQSATFDRTGLTTRGLEWLRDSAITELVLTEEEFLSDDAFEHVAKMKSLRTLVLDATPIEVTGLEHLQRCPQLLSFALRRVPAGSIKHRDDERLAAIARIDNLEELEIGSAAYAGLVIFKKLTSLRQLTLRRCGVSEASQSLKQLKQLDRVVLDKCDIRGETFDDVKTVLADVGIEVVDATGHVPTDLLTRDSLPINEATKLARRLHDGLDIAKHHPAFWVRWRCNDYDVPSMKAEPVRSIHRLNKALSEDHVRRPIAEQSIMAWAPRQFFVVWQTSQDDLLRWEQIVYGDAKVLRIRSRGPADLPKHSIHNGVSELLELFASIPQQLRISQQSYWWGVGIHHQIATSPVSPQRATYNELPAEVLAGETCRVLESVGRGERLWINRETGRLRGSLNYSHQGVSFPFHKQNIVTQIVGHPVKSPEEYWTLFGDGSQALPKEKQDLLGQAWNEFMSDYAIPVELCVFVDYREIAPGHWFPFLVQSTYSFPNDQNPARYDFYSSASVVTEVALDRDNLQTYWADVLPKKGETVQDQRQAPPVE